MEILIAGGTGLVGQALVRHFLSQKHQVIILGRARDKIKKIFNDRVSALEWSDLSADSLSDVDVVINLAGTNIGDRSWSKERKQSILTSRIQCTEKLSNILAGMGGGPPALFNASAVGYYGLQQEAERGLPEKLDEQTIIDWRDKKDYVSEVAGKWEAATEKAKQAGVRVVITRFGVVLSANGGALAKMTLPFKLGLGGVLGTGRQPFSWVAIDDLVSAFDFLIKHANISGPVNILSPHCVTQRAFAKTLAKVLHRPCFLKTPKIVLKTIFGEMAEELLLSGQHVYPTRLLEHGFEFKYPELEAALRHAYS